MHNQKLSGKELNKSLVVLEEKNKCINKLHNMRAV